MRTTHWSFALLALAVAALAPVLAQQSSEEAEQRAREMAARRAERDAGRAERLPSRPFVLREPVPLPVAPVLPPGGEAAGKSCPGGEACTVEYAVPSGKLLVVTAVWAATESRCDQSSLGASPTGGQVIAPWWHCARSLQVIGKGAGFSGYLFTAPAGD